jgi:hypothetical protein
MGLEPAKIRILTPLRGPNATDEIRVRFNPNEYSLVRNMNYAEATVPGLSNPVVQFVRGETQTLSLELYLDRSDRVAYAPRTTAAQASEGVGAAGGSTTQTSRFEGIEAELNLLRLLVTIDPDLHAPPIVEFTWGKLRFPGVVTSYTEKFQMFDENGHALRARVTLSLKRYESARVQARQLSLESPDRTKTRIVREGERLDVIAAEEYGDASRWPAIARANNLARPRLLTAGTVLVIPPL